jgi:hypothetical protein
MLGEELRGNGTWRGWGRKTERKRSEVDGRWLLKALRCAGQKGKGQGVRGGHCVEGGNGEERGGLGRGGGQLGLPALAPGRRARVVPLPRDRGG